MILLFALPCAPVAWDLTQATGDATPPRATIDVGTPEGRAFLGAGWHPDEAGPEGTFAWAGEAAEIRLPTREPVSVTARVRALSRSDGVWQELTIQAGDHATVVPVEPIWGDVRFDVPGADALTVRAAWAVSPSSTGESDDERLLSVAWDRLEVASARRPRGDATGLSIPVGSRLDLSIDPPEGALLRWDAVEGDGLVVTWTDAAGAVTPLASGSPLGPGQGRLSFEVPWNEPGWPLLSDVVVRAPRVEGMAPR